MVCSKWYPRPTQSGDIMSKKKQLDIDAYRAELTKLNDAQLFEEGELEHLREERMSEMMEDYKYHELDSMDDADLFGEEEWKSIRAAKVEKRLKEQFEDLE